MQGRYSLNANLHISVSPFSLYNWNSAHMIKDSFRPAKDPRGGSSRSTAVQTLAPLMTSCVLQQFDSAQHMWHNGFSTIHLAFDVFIHLDLQYHPIHRSQLLHFSASNERHLHPHLHSHFRGQFMSHRLWQETLDQQRRCCVCSTTLSHGLCTMRSIARYLTCMSGRLGTSRACVASV